jgi:hypothetical protein
LVAGAAGPARAGGNLVMNGDFATGDFTDWTLSGDDSQVYVSSGVLSGSAFQAALTTSGLGDGFLTQTLATTAGQQYQVSFLLGDDGSIPNSLTVSLGGTTLATLLGTGSNTLPAGTPYSFDVIAPSSGVLQFDFLDIPGYLYLTNISVTAVASAVPEPSTAVSATLGTLMVIGYFWRKRLKSNEV